ncbi:MAG TPA: YbaK/EbsC family protein [Gaiellaceae bacterium]|nr:YbaK/EbsC family protein [Gaiellaceae bacterium]
MERWPQPVERVAAVLRQARVEARLEEFPQGTSTAEAAAEAVGCATAQIVKSLLFFCDGRPVLALVPGDRRADPSKVASSAGARNAQVGKRDEVFAVTGFEPGAVAPFPAPQVSEVLLAEELLAHEMVWVGAGSPRHVAGLSPPDLVRLTRARTADLCE